MIRTVLLTTAILWLIEYLIEPSGGFPVTLILVIGDFFDKLARAVGAI